MLKIQMYRNGRKTEIYIFPPETRSVVFVKNRWQGNFLSYPSMHWQYSRYQYYTFQFLNCTLPIIIKLFTKQAIPGVQIENSRKVSEIQGLFKDNFIFIVQECPKIQGVWQPCLRILYQNIWRNSYKIVQLETLLLIFVAMYFVIASLWEEVNSASLHYHFLFSWKL